jgi:hypothetical protein
MPDNVRPGSIVPTLHHIVMIEQHRLSSSGTGCDVPQDGTTYTLPYLLAWDDLGRCWRAYPNITALVWYPVFQTFYGPVKNPTAHDL